MRPARDEGRSKGLSPILIVCGALFLSPLLMAVIVARTKPNQVVIEKRRGRQLQ
jgi:hypothetical protein